MTIDRRTLIAGGTALGLAATAAKGAQTGSAVPPDFTVLPLWPGKVPGGEHVTVTQEQGPRSAKSDAYDTFFAHITTPTLTVLRPAKPNGAALLMIPGGGYRRVVLGHEGINISRRFAQAGFTCFSLLYRLPADGWAAGPEAPLQDAQRALRTVRSLAPRYGYDANRIGVIGFSAGGHLAGWLASRQSVATQAVNDAIDREPLSPRAAALIYPVITMTAPLAHNGSRVELIGEPASDEKRRAYSLENAVEPTTPPTFLAHAIDDKTVPVENSLMMLASLRAAHIPAEAHLFETGGHGFGLTLPDGTASPWPDLFETFAKRHGLL